MIIQIEHTTKEMRCEKCWRIHPLEWLVINNTAVVGYRCASHKKSALGFYYIRKFHVLHRGLSKKFDVVGSLKELKKDWFEVNPAKARKHDVVSVQNQLLLI